MIRCPICWSLQLTICPCATKNHPTLKSALNLILTDMTFTLYLPCLNPTCTIAFVSSGTMCKVFKAALYQSAISVLYVMQSNMDACVLCLYRVYHKPSVCCVKYCNSDGCLPGELSWHCKPLLQSLWKSATTFTFEPINTQQLMFSDPVMQVLLI